MSTFNVLVVGISFNAMTSGEILGLAISGDFLFGDGDSLLQCSFHFLQAQDKRDSLTICCARGKLAGDFLDISIFPQVAADLVEESVKIHP